MGVQCGNGNETGKSVSLVVYVRSQFDKIELEEVPLSETIERILVRILTKIAELRHFPDSDYTRVADPELMALYVFPKTEGKNFSSSKATLSSEDQSQTLQEFLSVAGCFSSSSEGSSSKSSSFSEDGDSYSSKSSSSSEDGDSYSMSPIMLRLVPNWERYLTNKKKMQKDVDESGSDEELEVDGVACIVDKERPKLLPDNKDLMRVVGRLRVCFQDQNQNQNQTQNGIVNVKWHSVDYIGGLRCEPKDVVKLTTPAKRVLLVFNDHNLEFMERYYTYLKDDYTINPKDEVLILLVTWDKFSYWLLRMLRKSIGPQVPVIAFTDAHVHELDLLTFLDTPPREVSQHYGWSYDCADDLGSDLVDIVVDIKWAGVRPSDDDSPPAKANAISKYDIICKFLEQRGKWPSEVQYFKKFRFYQKGLGSIHSELHPECDPFRYRPYIWKEYIPQKLVNQDWI